MGKGHLANNTGGHDGSTTRLGEVRSVDYVNRVYNHFSVDVF